MAIRKSTLTTEKQMLTKIIKILESSERSEDPGSYGGEDSWGPAAGCAAKEAEEFNKELPKLIALIKKLRSVYD